jgi:crotonobetainyl-CoA:carnitine CoA-transferase CaiB-like acyl-CoA transferase
MGLGPFSDITVIDLTHVLSGPYCTMYLAEMGARVIKVEHAGHGDETRAFPPFFEHSSVYFASVNRGKESVALDFDNPGGPRGPAGDDPTRRRSRRESALRHPRASWA